MGDHTPIEKESYLSLATLKDIIKLHGLDRLNTFHPDPADANHFVASVPDEEQTSEESGAIFYILQERDSVLNSIILGRLEAKQDTSFSVFLGSDLEQGGEYLTTCLTVNEGIKLILTA